MEKQTDKELEDEIMEEKKRFSGHLWEMQNGWCTNWSGYSGSFLCKRCLSIIKAERDSNSRPYKYSDMRDMFGKIVPKNKWNICPADYKIKILTNQKSTINKEK
jgi:hypothetical protein